MSGPLTGLRVIEIAGLGPGPYACTLLADLGASVIRIERAEGSNSPNFEADARFQVTHRNRLSIRVNLKDSQGIEFVLSLIDRAQALVEGFRPRVAERLGLGPSVCLARNPRLVYGRMTGWGQTGPLAHTAGHDINYIALSGALHAIGGRNGPPVPPLNLVGDFGGGAMFLVFGVLSAVLSARQSGQGQVVDVAMVDGAISLMGAIFGRFAAGAWQDERGSNTLDGGMPWYGVYETSDEKHVAVGALEDRFFAVLVDKLGLDPSHLESRKDMSTWAQLRSDLVQTFRTRTRDEWGALLGGTDACVTPVLSLKEAPLHQHNVARGSFLEIDGVVQPSVAPRFSCTEVEAPKAAAECLDALERVWGVDDESMQGLKNRGVLKIQYI